MELDMVLKVLPIRGPSKRTTLITTRATNERIIAYSTSPWPLSFDANNMTEFLSLIKISEQYSQINSKTIQIMESYKASLIDCPLKDLYEINLSLLKSNLMLPLIPLVAQLFEISCSLNYVFRG